MGLGGGLLGEEEEEVHNLWWQDEVLLGWWANRYLSNSTNSANRARWAGRAGRPHPVHSMLYTITIIICTKRSKKQTSGRITTSPSFQRLHIPLTRRILVFVGSASSDLRALILLDLMRGSSG